MTSWMYVEYTIIHIENKLVYSCIYNRVTAWLLDT